MLKSPAQNRIQKHHDISTNSNAKVCILRIGTGKHLCHHNVSKTPAPWDQHTILWHTIHAHMHLRVFSRYVWVLLFYLSDTASLAGCLGRLFFIKCNTLTIFKHSRDSEVCHCVIWISQAILGFGLQVVEINGTKNNLKYQTHVGWLGLSYLCEVEELVSI